MGQDDDAGAGARARRRSTRRVYTGKVLSLDVDELEEPGGVRTTREVVRHLGSVAVLAAHDDGTVVLVRQYRYPVDDSLWELPAGRLDPGESPEEAAQRELQEEIGHRATSLRKIAFFYTTPGFCDEAMHVFRASGLVPAAAQGDEDERIEVRSFPLDELEAMIARGEVREGKTLVALLLELRARAER
ncbi:MAG TPA: NUDIX hydrolase [Vicinamibacteria bacterium]|nr:NUDIX hydrolase [Vicinamibacteria bacterium]